jgi:hypothetical protein
MAAGCFGCGDGASDAATSHPTRYRDELEVLRRGATARDVLPPAAHGGTYDGVDVDFESARHIGASTNRYRLWVSRGTTTGASAWRSSFDPTLVCLHLFDGRGAGAGFGCAPQATAANDPGRLMIVLSGGAQGAPGLRPREVVIAGVVPDDVREVWLEHRGERVADVPLSDNGFVQLTRTRVDGIGFLSASGPLRQRVNACQAC